MDSFFGIGAPELVIILLLAGIVLGPKRIQQVALWLGKMTAQLQAVSRGFTRQLNAELSSIDDGEMQDAWSEVQELRRQMLDLRREVTSAAFQPIAEGQKAIKETRHAVDNMIMPPTMGQHTAANGHGRGVDGKKPEAANSIHNDVLIDLPNLVDVDDDPDS